MPHAPIFIINLQRSPDRRMFMQTQLQSLGLKFEFFTAVDGQALTAQQVSYYDDDLRKKTGWFNHKLANNEIACVLSHLQIWEKMWKENIEHAIILEDDITLDEDFAQIINRENCYPKNYGNCTPHQITLPASAI